MEKPSITVSILTPVYNQVRYIAETLDSVLSQGYPNLEYLVIDDGSTDGTPEILKTYSNRIKLESQSNMGETATVNKGVAMLSGEIVGVINGDDPLLPGAVEAIAQRFIDDPDLAVVYPDWKMIDADGKLLEYRKTKDYDYANMVRGHNCLPGPGTFFRRELFLKLNGRDPNFRYVADFDFWLRAGLVGRFARIPQTLATHRWYSGGTSTAARGAAMAEEHIQLINKLFSQPDLPPAILRIKNEAFSTAYFTAGVCCGNDLPLKRSYYRKAFRLSPGKYLGEYRRWGFEILGAFIPWMYSSILNIKKAIDRYKK